MLKPKIIKGLLFAALIVTTLMRGGLLSAEGNKDTQPQTAVSTPFSRGFNFSGWFELYGVEEIPFGRYTEQDFADIKGLGADVIRLPVHFHRVTGGAPDYTIDPLFFRFLDKAVDWAEKYEIYIIIDFHFSEPGQSMDEVYDRMLFPVWAQIAQRYRDRSDYVVYEILNEPFGITDRRWGEVQGRAIETIRRYDTKHAIVVTYAGGGGYNDIEKLNSLPRYSDTNLIYTFHFYEPMLFTHQGADWVGPGMASVAGIPFPPDRSRMPRFLSEFKDTWVEYLYNNYSSEGDPSRIYRALDRIVTFSRQRNVPVYCGEFGVIRLNNAHQEDRVRWFQLLATALDERGISRTSWDYYGYGNFGIYNVVGGDFNSDLNVEVVNALGLTPPPQTPRPTQLNAGFTVYDGFPNRMLNVYYWGENADFSLYDTNSSNGEFAIRLGNADRYDVLKFLFNRIEDFTRLVSEGYSIELKARATSPVSFDVRFLNPESSSSIPWRMRYTVSLLGGSVWQTIRIPLRNMQEHGAFVEAAQQWLTPRGEFSWASVNELQICTEHSDMKDITVWFDDIKITR